MDDILRVGDMVIWRGAWGDEEPQEVQVQAITRALPGDKYGEDLQSLPWAEVRWSGCCVVDLPNGAWAYGSYILPLPRTVGRCPE